MRIFPGSGGSGQLGTPTDGSLLDGYTPLTTTQKVADAVDDLNEKLLAIAQNRTLESFTITIDPAGSDVASAGSVYNAASYAAHGAFKTMKGATDALPDNIDHNVIFSHVSGQHNPEHYELFGNFARFRFGTSNLDVFPNGRGRFTVTSASGRVRVGGTASYAVASTTDSSTFTLATNPGFTTDQYAGYHLRVVSGTGSGQVKSIRRHSGAGPWRVAGRFSPNLDATSIVEIVEAAAWINLDAKFYGLVKGNHVPEGQQVECLHLEEIDIKSTSASVNLEMTDVSVACVKSRMRGFTLLATDTFVTVDQGIFDGTPLGGDFGLVQVRGGYFRAWSSSSSWLIRKSLTHGLRLNGGTQSARMTSTSHIFEGAIDDCVDSALVLEGPNVTAFNATRLHGTGNGEYGVRMLRKAYYYPRTSDFTGTEYLRGTLGEINVDGAVKTYVDLVAAADKAMIGRFGSIADGNQPMVP